MEKKIKLLTIWRLKNKYEKREVDETLISHGLWEIIGLEGLDNSPVATFRCIMPCHKNLKQFDTRKLPFALIRYFCEEVMIISVDDDLKDIIRYKKLKKISE